MDAAGEIAVYTLLGLAMAAGIFWAALVFVNSTRRGNRRFKWGGSSGQERPPRP